jgi:hypothetical protein
MKHLDKALSIQHPRLISALYFGFLALFSIPIFDTLLVNLIINEPMLPTYKTVIIGTFTAMMMGFFFGEAILHAKRPYQKNVFFLGVWMTLAGLPIFNLLYLTLLIHHYHVAFLDAKFIQLFGIYFISLFQLFIMGGFWVAILAGFASLYLRGQLAYDILHTHYQKRHARVIQKRHHKTHHGHRLKKA